MLETVLRWRHLRDEETNVDFTSPGSRHRASLQDGPPSWGLDRIDQRGPVVSGDNSSYRYRPKAGETVHVYVLDTGIRSRLACILTAFGVERRLTCTNRSSGTWSGGFSNDDFRASALPYDDAATRTSHKDFGGRAVRELEVTEKGLHMCEDNDDEETRRREKMEMGRARQQKYDHFSVNFRDCAMDFQGHGTSIAGILGGHRYGVAKSATIHALKVLDDHGRGHSWQMMAAFDWLLVHAEQPAIAVLGSATQGQLSAWRAAADAASRAGITVVAAAGDEGDTAHPDACEYTPGYIPSVLTVGATTRHDTRANTSNFGQCINLMAPGEDLTSAGIGSDTAELRRSAGSALAAAHVAGAAALVLSEKPHLQSHEVIQRLIDSSTVGRLSHLHAAPDRLVNSLGEEVSVPSWAEEGMWSLVDGGKDRACGGLDGEEGEDFVAFREVHDLESCKARCEHSESTTGCAGISYSREEEICQIHVDLVRSSKQMTGYICLRHEAGDWECSKVDSCEASLYQDFGRVGNCWLRSKVDLPKCVKVPGYSLWLEASLFERSKSACPGPRPILERRSMKLPAVLLALASLVDGSCLLENKERDGCQRRVVGMADEGSNPIRAENENEDEVLKCATTEGCVDGEQVDATCLGACLQSDGVQQNCAGCLGEGLSCAVANCQNQCSPGHPNYYSSQCTQCLRQEKCRTCAFVAQTVNEEVANLAALALEAKAERSVDLPKAGGFCYEERCEFSSAAPKGMHCQFWPRRGPAASDDVFDQAKLKKCGTECLARPQRAQCATDCLRRWGMKPGCARCFGDKVDCTIRKCLDKCMADSHSPRCKSCVRRKCGTCLYDA
eukprot:g30555.t1